MDKLLDSLQSVIKNERIGNPVFLRVVMNVSENNQGLIFPISQLFYFSNTLILSLVQSVFAQGSDESNQVTAMVHYEDGQMALLSTNRVDTQTDLDLMLVGTKGVIYHQTPIGRNYLSGTPPQVRENVIIAQDLKQSLITGKPILVEE
ncbi:hypothetical protein JT359_18780 [Candidatus Poribacteria bacterium]|nr:hypothetical protein [Candidatus Poribacteria bacterium]